MSAKNAEKAIRRTFLLSNGFLSIDIRWVGNLKRLYPVLGDSKQKTGKNQKNQ